MAARHRVGDDVVDLAILAEDKQRDARFVGRVLAPEEEVLLARAPEPGLLLWLLWAAKEASFKVGRKLAPELVFAHARFVVRPHLDARGAIGVSGTGVVAHGDFSAHFAWHRAAGYLHVLASSAGRAAEPAAGVVSAVRALASPSPSPRASSLAARALALELLHARGLADCRISEPGRGPGWPCPPLVLQHGRALADWDLSLSHDGAFVSATLLPAP